VKAVVLHAPGHLELEEKPQPIPTANQALVRVHAAGICGSDVHAFRGSSAFQVYPTIPGHEIAGEVVALGERVNSLAVGDHVVLDPMIRCGKCYPCSVGRYNCCTSMQVMGVHTDGGFVQYLAVDATRLYRIEDSLPFQLAALAEPLCVSAQAVSRGRVCAEDSVAIIGAGTIGLGCLVMAKEMGATVASIDLVQDRLDAASRLGADVTIRADQENVQQAILDWTKGTGATVVIEAAGNRATTRAALDYVSSAGRVVIVGITTQEVPFPVPLLVRKELDVIASRNSREQFPRAVRLIESDKFQLQEMISHVLPLDRISDAFALLTKQPPAARKVILTFD